MDPSSPVPSIRFDSIRMCETDSRRRFRPWQDLEIAKKAIQGVTNGEIELEHKDISVKGWNWGKVDVRGESSDSRSSSRMGSRRRATRTSWTDARYGSCGLISQ